MTRQCEQCRRRLYPGEGDICRFCIEHNEGVLHAHELMYGREEREMAEAREEAYAFDQENRDFEEDELEHI